MVILPCTYLITKKLCVSQPMFAMRHHRLSTQSYESGRTSYHSCSSSSLGSLDRLEESGLSNQVNVAELFNAGYQVCQSRKLNNLERCAAILYIFEREF